MQIIEAVEKPFSSFPRALHSFGVDPDGTVTVYDSVAGHYTICHSLSADSQARIRRLARQFA